MTLSPFQKALVSSVCVSSAVFTIATVPLAMFRSQPVEVQVQNEAVFASELNALAGPYVGVAGALSLALGAGILGVSGWRLAATKSEAEQAKSSDLQRDLMASQAELERIKFSDARLKAQGLEAFLGGENTQVPPSTSSPSYRLSTVETPETLLVTQNQSSSDQSDALVHKQNLLKTISETKSPQRQPVHGYNSRISVDKRFEQVIHRSQELTAQLMASHGRPLSHGASTSTASLRSSEAIAPTYGNLSKQSAPTPNHLEAQSENQFETLLHQLRDLTAQVEDLRAGSSSQAVGWRSVQHP